MINFIVDDNFGGELKRLAKNVKRGTQKLHDRTEPLQKIKKRQVKRWAVNFDRSGSIYGAWAPLADWTVANRIGGTGRKPLVETGALREYFMSMNNEGQITTAELSWDFKNRGGFSGGPQHILEQHFGIDPNKGLGGGLAPVPARVLWDLNAEDRDAAEDIMFQWVERIVDMYFGV